MILMMKKLVDILSLFWCFVYGYIVIGYIKCNLESYLWMYGIIFYVYIGLLMVKWYIKILYKLMNFLWFKSVIYM